MTKNEATIMLMKCRPFAKRLVSQGINIRPSREEEKALYGFSKVWTSGWLEGYSVQLMAGLSSNEVNCLTIKMVQEVTHRFIPTTELAATGS